MQNATSLCFYKKQGNVATYVRRGGIFSHSGIRNFILRLAVKKFKNRLIFDKVKAYKKC